MKSDKDFRAMKVPPSLHRLPRFGFTPSRAGSREDSARADIAFGVLSTDDLIEALGRGFATPPPEPIRKPDRQPGAISKFGRRILKSNPK